MSLITTIMNAVPDPLSVRNKYKMLLRRYKKQRKGPLMFGGYIKDCLQRSTIHCLKHFIAPKRHPLETIVWFIIMVISVYCTFTSIKSTYEHYIESPVVVSVEKNFRDWTFNSPAMTVCFTDKVDDDKAKQYISRTWGKVDEKKEAYYMRFIKTVANMTYGNLDGFKEFAKDSTLENINMVELVMQVYYDTQRVKYSDSSSDETIVIEKMSINELGFCNPVNSLIEYEFEPINSSAIEEPTAKTCSAADEGSCYINTELPREAYFYIHSALEIPDSTSRKIPILERGIWVHVIIRNYEVVTSPEVRKLHPKQRRCLFMDEGKAYNLHQYSYNLCVMQCRRKLAISICGCSPPFYHHFNLKGKEKICNSTGLACLSNYADNLLKLRNLKNRKVDCNCMGDCEVLRFIPSHTTAQRDQHGNMRIATALIQDFGRTRYRMDVLYTFDDLLVSFGGAAGFFLGCSILSVVEAIYFCTLRLFFYLVNRKRTSIGPGFRRRRFLVFNDYL